MHFLSGTVLAPADRFAGIVTAELHGHRSQIYVPTPHTCMQVDRQNFLHAIARGPDEELSEKYICPLFLLPWQRFDGRARTSGPPCVEPTRVSLALPADTTDKAAACFYVA